MGEIFNLDDMIKKEMKGFKKDENSSAKPSEYLREYADTGRNHSVIFGYSRRISPRYDWSN